MIKKEDLSCDLVATSCKHKGIGKWKLLNHVKHVLHKFVAAVCCDHLDLSTHFKKCNSKCIHKCLYNIRLYPCAIQ